MASDVMSVRLHLVRIEVLGVLVDECDELRVRVCSTVRRPRCRACGARCHRVHDRRDKMIRDLEVYGNDHAGTEVEHWQRHCSASSVRYCGGSCTVRCDTQALAVGYPNATVFLAVVTIMPARSSRRR